MFGEEDIKRLEGKDVFVELGRAFAYNIVVSRGTLLLSFPRELVHT